MTRKASGGPTLDRRRFLAVAGTGAGILAAGGAGLLAGACSDDDITGGDPPGPDERPRLPIPPEASATGLSLTAAAAALSAGSGRTFSGLAFNTASPAPTIRARRGEEVRITLHNGLDEATIVHWHGLLVPEAADGHPRYAIAPGAAYDYAFSIEQRAGTYWYHPHAHGSTARQVYLGLAGLFLVGDEEEDALGLPGGGREVPLVLQDRRVGGDGSITYDPGATDELAGLLGDVVFVNGEPTPVLEVDTALYRLRILNASNARVYELALDSGAPLVLIGNDGGLLEAPVEVASITLSPAERVDVLVDFSGLRQSDRVVLRSLPFDLAPVGGESTPQGVALDVLEFEVAREVSDVARVPARLSTIPKLSRAEVGAERTFAFTSTGSHHAINGASFEMERVDVQVPLGRTELWTFVNSSPVPHPVHVHGARFQVQSRSGGRAALIPSEQGWKDTVLLMPQEQVEVLIRFDAYAGLYLLHCHNLEHGDMGMMLNVEAT